MDESGRKMCRNQKKPYDFYYLLAHVLHGVREVAEDLVLFSIYPLALGMDPPAAFGALHHPRLVVVVVITTFAKRAVAALFLLEAAGRTERRTLEVMGDVSLAARVATEALETDLQEQVHCVRHT